MDIEKVIIENWQCIKYLTIEFEKLMILIGEGNRGKTSTISAIMASLHCKSIKESDFYNESLNIVIRLKLKTSRGFVTLKFIKKPDLTEEYYEIYRGNEKKLLDVEYKKRIEKLKIIKMSSKDIQIKDAFCNIRDLSSVKNEKILKDLNGKIDFLEKNRASQSLQRKILFSFFKNILKEIKKENIKNETYNTILIFEEPELHLNPQSSRELYDILIKLSKIGIQIIIETHSSYFVGIKQYKSICLIKKLYGQVTAFQHTKELFNGDEIKNFNMNYWINPDRGEIFFAKKVILVEGQTDKIAISFLAKKLGIYKYRYSIIECGSKSTIPQFIKVLNAYKISYVAVYDRDNHSWRNEKELEISRLKNKKIKKLVNKKIGGYIEFENDIEEEIFNEKRERKNYKNKPYYTLQEISKIHYKLSGRLEDKIKRIYE